MLNRGALVVLALSLLFGCAARRAPATAASEPSTTCASFDGRKLERRLDRRTDSRELAGNGVTLLVDGAQSFARRAENAEDAELILVKTFIFTDDEAGRAVASLLARRAQAGATVIVQYDVKGSAEGSGALLDLAAKAGDKRGPPQKKLMVELAASGVHVVPTNAPRRERGMARWQATRERTQRDLADLTLAERLVGISNLTHFDHEKYWITGHRTADGGVELRAILGGLNIASEYAYGGTTAVDAETGRGGWRDTDVEVRGPAARDVLDRYLDLLDRYKVEIPGFDADAWSVEQARAGEAEVRFVWNQPAFGNRRSVERLYRTLINATPAGEPIALQSAYFAPGRRLLDDLKDALRRGTPLTIMTNSQDSVDVPLVTDASLGLYGRLLKVDPEAALYQWVPRPETGHFTMHSKVASFGRCGPVIIGSANLDGLSSERNSESVLLIDDPALRAAFDAMMQADLHPSCADRVTAEEAAKQGLAVRIWRRLIYNVGWTWLGTR